MFLWGCGLSPRPCPLSLVVAVLALPSVSAVSRSACCLSASGFAVRPSSRGLGGFVAAVGFRRPAAAAAFAVLWARALPSVCRGCVVRVASGLSWVSVPVLAASVPAVVVAGGGPLVVVGSPPSVRSAVASSPLWAAAPAPAPVVPVPPPPRPAPGSRRLLFAAVFAVGWPFPASPVPSAVSAAVSAAPAVAFCGSRRVAPPSGVLAGVAGLVAPLAPVLVGCVGGLCAAVRSRFPAARVFRASSFGSGASAFARRSVALVRACAAAGGVWLSFPASACPPGLRPSASSSACFSGSGSGSWASLCFAVGSGVPAFVWLPAGCVAPSWLVSLGGGWFRAVLPVPPSWPRLPGF